MHNADTSNNDNFKFKREVNDDLAFPRICV